DLVVERPVRGKVGETAVLQRLREIEHLANVLRGAWEDVPWREVGEGRGGVEAGLVGVGDLRAGLVLELGGDQHPILTPIEAFVAQVPDVGDVLDMEDIQAVVEEGPADEVREEEGAQVADMRPATDRRAAGVEPAAG